MFLRKATQDEIQHVATNLSDYDLTEDMREDGVKFVLISDSDISGLIQITQHPTFSTIDTYILPPFRGKWLTKATMKSLYRIVFKHTDAVVIQTSNVKSGRIASKLGFIPYGFDEENTLFVLHKQNFNKEWKIDGK